MSLTPRMVVRPICHQKLKTTPSLYRHYSSPCHPVSSEISLKPTTNQAESSKAGESSKAEEKEDGRKIGGHGRLKGRKSPYTSLMSRRGSIGGTGSRSGMTMTSDTKIASSGWNFKRPRSNTQQRIPGVDYTASEHIRDPTAFKPIEIGQSSFNLHTALTPSHMPLPLTLGTHHYTNPRMSYSGEFYKVPFSTVISKNVHRLGKSRKTSKWTVVEQHLNIHTMFSHPELVEFLGGAVKPINYGTASSADAAPAEHDTMAPPRLVSDSRSAMIEQADASWEATVQKMESGLRKFDGKEEIAVNAAGEAANAEALDAAVSEVNDLLKSMSFKERSASPFTLRARENRRLAAIGHQSHGESSLFSKNWKTGRGMVVSMGRTADEAMQMGVIGGEDFDVVDMDSVQRKRRKKISKHK